MLGWWRKAAGDVPLPELKLNDIPAAWKESDQFALVDWNHVDAWVARHWESNPGPAYWALVGDWLKELSNDTGGKLERSRHFWTLTPYEKTKLKLLMEFLELAHKKLEQLLDLEPLNRPLVVVVLENQTDYLEYLSEYMPAGELGSSVGVCLREGYVHIATYHREVLDLQTTLAHELVHALLGARDLPAWLEEGLAQLLPILLGLPSSALTRLTEEHGKNRLCWRRHGIDGFWNGRDFWAHDERQKFAYQLAEIITRLILEDPQASRGFADFVREAEAADAGETAARKHLGKSLAEFAQLFLGPGHWQPLRGAR